MKALKIYIVEDEPLITATIETALRKQGFNIAGNSDEYDTALKQIETHRPDLVLLDINLEGVKDGVDLALTLDTKNIPYLYLTSQTDPSTIERVKQTKPLGFIVKPFTEAGLRSNIELAWHNFKLTDAEFLLLKSEGRLHKIDQANILYLKAFDNYCYVTTTARQFLAPNTLKHVSEKLNPNFFIKIHRSFVVNIRKVVSTNKNSVVVKDETLPLSSGHKESFLNRLKNL